MNEVGVEELAAYFEDNLNKDTFVAVDSGCWSYLSGECIVLYNNYLKNNRITKEDIEVKYVNGIFKFEENQYISNKLNEIAS